MITLLLALHTGLAATSEDVRACLAANDVTCAEVAILALGAATSSDPTMLALAAETAFYGGRYEEAATLGKKARDLGYVDKHEDVDLYERTAQATASWAEVRTDRFIVRYRPGVDAIIVDEALETLEATEKNLTPLLGGPPPGPTILEIYPDGASFIDASSLPREAVETTGVVALSKWSRLLALSPRALGRGYAWKDTIAHEYVHLVVANKTNDRTPVWMQEAIARYLEGRRKDGLDHFKLTPRDQALLGTAVREEQGDLEPAKQKRLASNPNVLVGLLTFAQMHPSLALLPSAESAALAYAQVSSLMSYAFKAGGEDVLVKALPMIRDGKDARDALAEAVGAGRFAVLEGEWLDWLETQPFDQTPVAELLTALDGADESASDPVMAERADLRRYMRLGDLLREEGRPTAALKEYSQAFDPDEPPSPMLSNRIAQAHLDLGHTEAARKDLEESLRYYPEYALSHKTLAKIREEAGESKLALTAYREALELNPYDPDVLAAVSRLAKAQGLSAVAARADEDLKILKRGGQETRDVHLIKDAK